MIVSICADDAKAKEELPGAAENLLKEMRFRDTITETKLKTTGTDAVVSVDNDEAGVANVSVVTIRASRVDFKLKNVGTYSEELPFYVGKKMIS